MTRRIVGWSISLPVHDTTTLQVDGATIAGRGCAIVLLAGWLCGCVHSAEPLPVPPSPIPPPELLSCPAPEGAPPRPPRVVSAQRLSQAYAALDAAYAAERRRANLCAARLAGAARALRER